MDTTNTVTITASEYKKLIEDQLWLQCLEEAGVDNWQGFDEARNIWREYQEE